MSYWTHITGAVEVSVPGRTQAEIDYILRTILDHLPRVTGSEGDMEVHINRYDGTNSSMSCDEYQMHTNNLDDWHGCGKSHRGWLNTQDNYTLTLHADLRDRNLKQTVREFMKWLCRLSKRLLVESVLVRIDDGWNKSLLINESGTSTQYWSMHESPSWANENHEPAWWEHLMWQRWSDTPFPLTHVVKYYDDPEADAEYEKRFEEGDK